MNRTKIKHAEHQIVCKDGLTAQLLTFEVYIIKTHHPLFLSP